MIYPMVILSRLAQLVWSIVNKMSLIFRIGLPLLIFGVFIPRAALAEDITAPRIVHEACEAYEIDKPVELRAKFYDESPIFDPKVIWRMASGGDWKYAEFKKDRATEVFVAKFKADYRAPIEYFIEVFDENGNGPARLGTPEAPVKLIASKRSVRCIQIPAASLGIIKTQAGSAVVDPLGGVPGEVDAGWCSGDDAPFYCSPWFLSTSIALVAAGAGVGGYYLFRDPGAVQPPAKVAVSITGPSPIKLQ